MEETIIIKTYIIHKMPMKNQSQLKCTKSYASFAIKSNSYFGVKTKKNKLIYIKTLVISTIYDIST